MLVPGSAATGIGVLVPGSTGSEVGGSTAAGLEGGVGVGVTGVGVEVGDARTG